MILEDITRPVGSSLNDPNHVRWRVAELADYVDQAQAQIVLMVPDANSVTAAFSLAEGTRQVIPNDGFQLLRVIRNLGPDGDQPGRPILPTIRSALDAETPDWHSRFGFEVQHFVYDPGADKRAFYVFPATEGKIEIVYSKEPAKLQRQGTGNSAHVDTSQPLELAGRYMNPIIDWVLYRCWQKDAEYAGAQGRAEGHERAFYQQLGIKYQATEATEPTRRVRGPEAQRTVQ